MITEKQCEFCGTTFSFYPVKESPSTKNWLKRKCCSKRCAMELRARSYRRPGKIKCRECGTWKSIHKFYHRPKFRWPNRTCIECNRKKALDYWHKVNNESVTAFLKRLVSKARGSAKQRKLDFDLDKQYVVNLFKIQNGLCAISGEPMTNIVTKGKVYTNISIDRIDSSCGYTKGNIQLVCFVVNLMKSTMGLKELIQWSERIVKNAS